MSTDITDLVEVRRDGRWQFASDPFPSDDPGRGATWPAFGDVRDYGLFGFLADVRNYSMVPTIAEPRGLPDDVSEEIRQEWDDDSDIGGNNASWLSLTELLAFDYDQEFEERSDGHGTLPEGRGVRTTVRKLLGDWYFERLALLGGLGAPEDVRLVFWFD